MRVLVVYGILVGVLAGMCCWAEHAGHSWEALVYGGLSLACVVLAMGLAWATIQLGPHGLAWGLLIGTVGAFAGVAYGVDRGTPWMLAAVAGAGIGVFCTGHLAHHVEAMRVENDEEHFLLVSIGAAAAAAALGAEMCHGTAEFLATMGGATVGGLAGAVLAPISMAREDADDEERLHRW